MVEHPVIAKRSHSVQWKREASNLSQKKLATLRDSPGWTLSQMADHYGVGTTTIKRYLYGLDRTSNKRTSP